ncbi:MAG: DUF4493 domain-containing protein [Lachnoclostridium sp.]|nr:DUF4493 domain-containing protein [Lachnoclostridium sp.]
MKKNLLKGAVLSVGFALALSSCSDDSSSIGAGMGRIMPEIEVDPDVISASTPSLGRGNEDVAVTAADLKIRLTAADGNYSKEWSSVDEFDTTQDFKTGSYTLEAYYGSEDDAEGFGKPYYYGKQELEVKYDKTTSVSLSASMTNARVKVAYTDAFREYMSSYTAQVHTPQGKYIDYEASEDNPVYVMPGTVNINLTFTKPNGTTATLEAARFTAKVKTEHVVTFDVNNGDAGADAVLSVKFDSTIDEENIEIDLSDDILNAPAPEAIAEGFVSGQNFEYVEHFAPTDPVKINVTARGKIASVMLSTDSKTLREAGWPADLDLAKVDDATRARLEMLGLKTRGIWTNPDIMGVIDFTNVFGNLVVSTGLEESVNTFTLQVKDRYGKLSEPLTFTATVSKGVLTISSATALFGYEELTLGVEYNGADLEKNVKFQMRNELGAWTDLTVKTVNKAKSRALAAGHYDVVVATPMAIEKAIVVRAVFGDVISNDVTVDPTIPDFTIASAPEDVFATKAYVDILCDNYDVAVLKKYVAKSVNFTLDGDDLVALNLTPASENEITVNVGPKSSSITVTTEATTQLPNSDMESWYNVDAYTHQTKYVIGTTGMTDIKCWYPNSQGESFWATRNPRTTAQNSGTTCYYTSYSGTLPVNGYSGNAAEISTLGYGTGSTYTELGGSCKYKLAGMLFIGNYTAADETSETIDYGKPFTSRPSAFKFKYKYAPVESESFKAYAVVENRDNGVTQLGRGEIVSADAKGGFTDATVDIKYSNRTLKATHLTIVFVSSTADSPATKDVKGSKNAMNGYSDSKRIGSVLTVDDINLVY